jgi:hypothetical protein
MLQQYPAPVIELFCNQSNYFEADKNQYYLNSVKIECLKLIASLMDFIHNHSAYDLRYFEAGLFQKIKLIAPIARVPGFL